MVTISNPPYLTLTNTPHTYIPHTGLLINRKAFKGAVPIKGRARQKFTKQGKSQEESHFPLQSFARTTFIGAIRHWVLCSHSWIYDLLEKNLLLTSNLDGVLDFNGFKGGHLAHIVSSIRFFSQRNDQSVANHAPILISFSDQLNSRIIFNHHLFTNSHKFITLFPQ